MAHDRFCPLDSLPEADCIICDDLKAARDEVRAELNDTWQHVLRENEIRAYQRGYADATCGRPAEP
jgi:hypothetical protein